MSSNIDRGASWPEKPSLLTYQPESEITSWIPSSESRKSITQVLPKETFYERISRLIGNVGKYLMSCFCFSKKANAATSNSLSLFYQIQEEPQKDQITDGKLTAIAATTDGNTVGVEVPCKSSFQAGSPFRQELATNLSSAIVEQLIKAKEQGPDLLRKQFLLDYCRSTSYQIERSPNDTINIKEDDAENATNKMKAFLGEDFDAIITIANQSLGNELCQSLVLAPAQLIEYVALTDNGEDACSLDYHLSKIENANHPPRFILTFSNSGSGKILFKKNEQDQSFDVLSLSSDTIKNIPDIDEKDKNPTMMVRAIISIEISRNEQFDDQKPIGKDNPSHRVICSQLETEYNITTS